MAISADDRTGARLRPTGGFVWRTPLLPVDDVVAWRGHADAGRARLREGLAEAVDRPEIREALHLASPRIESAIDAWRADPESKRGQRVERSLVRYLTRMATRPTPFGLLAGVSTGELGPRTRLELAGRDAYQRHTQMDADVLAGVVEALTAEAVQRGEARLRPNDSGYLAAGELRFVQARQDGARRSHRLAALPDHPAVRTVFARAAAGATTRELVDALIDDGHTVAAAQRFVARLVDRQVLLCEVALPVTTDAPARVVADDLAACESAAEGAERLAEVNEALEKIDAAGIGVAPEEYRAIRGRLSALPGTGELGETGDPFHAVLVKPATASLGPRVVAAFERGLDVLHAQARAERDDPLGVFREDFVARYDTREVPLLEALDGEVGVGYGSSAPPNPLLRDVPFPGGTGAAAGGNEPPGEAGGGNPEAGGGAGGHHEAGEGMGGDAGDGLDAGEQAWTARERVLLSLVERALRSGASTIDLTDADVEALRAATRPAPLPDTLALAGTVLAASGDDVDEGRFRLVLTGGGGPSGARLLGRFCHADPKIREIVQAQVQAEEAADPETLFAEVVHLPAGRMGNVVLRPVLRGWEIPYLGRSGASAEAQLPVTDLRVSVRGDRVVLRSARFGCRVEPRLTSAHNARIRGLPVYRFLSDLQGQGTARGLAWEWGPLAALSHLPRVTCGEVVLAPQRWRVGADELAGLNGLGDAERSAAVARWRDARGLPELVSVAERDQRLVTDLGDPLAVDSLLHLAGRRGALTIEECFLSRDDLVATGPEGRFAHEIIVPFAREVAQRPREGGDEAEGTRGKSTSPRPTSPGRTSPRLVGGIGDVGRIAPSPYSATRAVSARRRFGPGSSWLYAKVYTGASTADAVLHEVVGPWCRELLSAGSASGWFFVRLADPQWHLRVRVHGDPARLHEEALPALERALAPCLADGRVGRWQLDTYERELEALGGPEAIGLVEQLFAADSEAALDVVAAAGTGEAGLDTRWRLALAGMHLALDDLGLGAEDRRALLGELREGYAREHRADETTVRALARRFREERAGIDAVLHAAGNGPGEAATVAPPLAAGIAALHRRAHAWEAPIARLRALDRAGRLTITWPQLAERVLHLHANRVLRAAHRRSEYALYELLGRFDEAERARAAAANETWSRKGHR